MEYETVVQDSLRLFNRYILQLGIFVLIEMAFGYGLVYLLTFFVPAYKNQALLIASSVRNPFFFLLLPVGFNIFKFSFSIFINGIFILYLLNRENNTNARFSALIFYSLKRVLPSLLTLFIMEVGSFLGILLLVIPGFIFIVASSQSLYFCLIEGFGPIRSVRASFELTKGNRMKIFIISLVFGVIVIAAAFALESLKIPALAVSLLEYAMGAYFFILNYAIWRSLRSTL